MTTQTTTIRTANNGMRALIGTTAASLAVLGGALLWQGRQGGDTAAPPTTSGGTLVERAAADAAPPFGVPALTDGFGRYATAPQASAAGVSTDGMTGRHEGRAAADAAPDLTVPALTDGAGHYLTAQPLAAARATTARGAASGDCGTTSHLGPTDVGPVDC